MCVSEGYTRAEVVSMPFFVFKDIIKDLQSRESRKRMQYLEDLDHVLSQKMDMWISLEDRKKDDYKKMLEQRENFYMNLLRGAHDH